MGAGNHAVLELEVTAVSSADQDVALVLRQVVLAGGLDVQVPVEALVGELRGRIAEPTERKTKKKTVKKANSKTAAAKASISGGHVVWSVDDHQYNQLFLARGADFLSSDRDGDGSISLSELWLASGRISVSTFRFEEVEEVFHQVDVGKNGVLDVTEYLNAISFLDTDGD